MEPDEGFGRRGLIRGLAGVGLGAVAGCLDDARGPDGDEIANGTVVFTDGNGEWTGTGTTTGDGPGEFPDDAPPSAVFDGGDTRAFVDALEALKRAGGGTLHVEPGTYRFDEITGETPSGPHATLESLTDVTIEGNGATIEFTEPTMLGLEFVTGSDLVLRNLTFDYRPVPFSQGTIVDLDPEGRSLRLSLDPGYPPLDHEMFEVPADVTALVHRPDGTFIRGVRKEGRWDPAMAAMDRVESGVFDLRLTADSSLTGLETGRKLTVLARNNRSALYFYKVDGLTVENVTVRAANGAAFGTGVCRNPVFRDCVIAPPPDSDRHISADADGIRIINALDSTLVEGCRHERLGDDSLVVQHTLGTVTEIVDDHTVGVEDTHPFVIAVGDPLDALSPTGVPLGRLPEVTAYTDWHESYPGERGKPETVTFAEPIVDRLSPGDFLRNRATGSGNFTVRRNEFRDHRANLVRIAASDGVVEENVLEGCSINPIELETDTAGFFAPKGWVRNVTVRNNEISRAGLNYFTGSSPAGIRVHHRPAPDTPTEGRPNRNIEIVGNAISDGASLGIEIHAAEGVRVRENALADLNRLRYGPRSPFGIGVDDSTDVTVSDNTVTGTDDALSGFGWKRESEAVSASGNELVLDGESRVGRLLSWVPLTFSFDETLSWAEREPGNADERPLAIFCFEIVFLDDTGTVKTVDVGGAERDVVFEGGAYPPSTATGEAGRWLGGPDATATLYVPEPVRERTTRLRVRGLPMAESITMRVSTGDGRSDAVRFGTLEPSTFTLDLS